MSGGAPRRVNWVARRTEVNLTPGFGDRYPRHLCIGNISVCIIAALSQEKGVNRGKVI